MKEIMCKGLMALIIALGMTGMANALCLDNDGYVYVYSSCVTDRRSNPKDLCEIGYDEEITTVYFFSNVAFDDHDDRRFPKGVFFDEIQIQHGMKMNGNDSRCFDDKREARDHLRKKIANMKKGGNVIKYVDVGSEW